MKIAVIASSVLPKPGGLERHVDTLARGLAQRGAEVEVVAGSLRFAVSPRVLERLRFIAGAFDLVDVHTDQAALGLAVARTGPRRLVFTPHAPIQRLVAWPHGHAMRALTYACDRIVCSSEVERELLCRTFPRAARGTYVVPPAVDAEAIQAARPFGRVASVVLAVGRLERSKGFDHVIAAMASLDPAFRLVIVGDGPARDRLRAHAADLRVESRVKFVGSVPDRDLYRWLRTARVVVTLPAAHSSGSQVSEALAAGAPVVASDIPVHREVASRFDRGKVIFVPVQASPLDIADAVAQLAPIALPAPAPAFASDSSVATPDSAVDRVLSIYERLVHRGAHAVADDRGRGGGVELPVPGEAYAQAVSQHTIGG